MSVRLRLLLAALALGAAVALLALDVPPVPTWFYVFAWYPTLLLLDTLVVRLGGESLLARPRALLGMLSWSAGIWLLFEALNFRLQNWYYVFLPAHRVERWVGITLSFATVVPAIVLLERALDRIGLGRRLVSRPVAIGPRSLAVTLGVGAATLAATLAAPRYLYPWTWGALWLVAEPALYRTHPAQSLLGDLGRGQWGRIARLMVAGLVAGAVWETYNARARGQWIYTVPFLEDVKLFEMPPLGFLGFPFFALEAWSLYHLLAAQARRLALIGAAAFGVLVLAGMDRWTISSTTPRLPELPGITAETRERLEGAALDDVFTLARLPAESLARLGGLSAEQAQAVRDAARLSTLRGIGTRHASALTAGGITSVAALAAADPAVVWRLARRQGDARPTPAEVRVWVRAARRAVTAETRAAPPTPSG